MWKSNYGWQKGEEIRALEPLFTFGKVTCFVRYKVLTAASVKVTSFWDIAPCIPAEADRRFRS
jgi:hypothetical protein